MTINRRTMILGAGGAAVLIGSGTAWRVTQVPRTAVQPWEIDAGPVLDDVRLEAFRHAILAPNPHNKQPWQIRLVGDDRATLMCDPERRLPETDPFDRQITIGFGCFIELAAIAAAEQGVAIDVDSFPEGEGVVIGNRPVATLRFRRDPLIKPDRLVSVIPDRRSTKEMYDPKKPIAPRILTALVAPSTLAMIHHATSDAGVLVPLRDIVKRAFALETRIPRTYRESIDVMRIGHAEIDANPDGIDLSGPLIEGLSLAGMIDRQQLADPTSMAYRQGLDQQLSIYGSIPGAFWLATPGNSRAEQIAAGRAYARANLTATMLGLSMHPVSQSLQEYPEMNRQFDLVHRLLKAPSGGRIQMLARIGHGPSVGPSPRWPLESKLIA